MLFVALGCGMVNLEELHSGRAEPQRSTVATGTEDHHLVDSIGHGPQDRVIEEPRPDRDVVKEVAATGPGRRVRAQGW